VKNVAADKTPYLQMKGITKQFPGVLALNNVDFSVELGKVVALGRRKRSWQINFDENTIRRPE
jgi:ABC-type uncharacterized transport system ATPase subunit